MSLKCSETGIGDENQQTKNATLDSIERKVEELYKFRDRYFEDHSLEEAVNRNKDTQNQLDVVLEDFKKNEEVLVKLDAARYYFLKGKALNVVPKHSPEAEEMLSKAIKLDPKLVDAWNDLGESYWKNDKLKDAETCFTSANKHRKNKVSLRNLSMLARQENAKSREESIKNIEKGLVYAKEAINLDPQDGLSWAVLGNAHLSSFFGIQQNPKILKQCLVAYTQAEKDLIARSTPDLHYNKGITLKYEEEYQQALESFSKASLYDPIWEPPKVKKKQLVKYLKEITDLVSTSGKMKAKRLQQTIQSIDRKHLGPYSGGSYTSSTGQTVVLRETTFNDLKLGLNEETVVLGKVVCSVHNEDTVPFTFCMVDSSGVCVAVSVFNLADGKGVIIGDSVAIPEPYVTDVDFTYEENKYKFRLIRVETPLVMVLNGKKANRNLQAGVHMSIFKKFD